MPTLKKLLAHQRQDVSRRVRHEQRLLCNAFRERNQNQWYVHRTISMPLLRQDAQGMHLYICHGIVSQESGVLVVSRGDFRVHGTKPISSENKERLDKVCV